MKLAVLILHYLKKTVFR